MFHAVYYSPLLHNILIPLHIHYDVDVVGISNYYKPKSFISQNILIYFLLFSVKTQTINLKKYKTKQTLRNTKFKFSITTIHKAYTYTFKF